MAPTGKIQGLFAALLSATVVFTGSSFAPPATSTVAPDMLLSDGVSVSRTSPYTTAAKLQADDVVDAISDDVADFCAVAQDLSQVLDLVAFLEDRHDDVSGPHFDPATYTYVVGPDGFVYEICHVTARIEIADGEDEPIVIVVHLVDQL